MSIDYERRILAGIRYSRLFVETSIDRRDILEIVEMARWAPSIGNIQPWELVIVDDKLLIHKLSRLHPAGRLFEKAAVLFFIVTHPEQSPHHLIDGGSLMAYLMLASSIKGYGVFPLQLQDDPVFKSELNIPPKLYLLGLVAVGKPAPGLRSFQPRKPLEAIIYYNKYGLRH